MNYKPPFQVSTIQISTEKTDSGIFTDFMLEVILKTLNENGGYRAIP